MIGMLVEVAWFVTWACEQVAVALEDIGEWWS